MANWYGTARSNYFKVKDLEAFKELLNKLNLVLIDNEKEGDEKGYGFYVNGEDGLPNDYYDEEKDDYVECDLTEELPKHLAEGEVAVMMQVGAEKVRYLSGQAIAVAWDGRVTTVQLDDIYNKALAEFGVMPTDASY